MPRSDWQKHVFEHSPIQQIAPRLWSVTGKLPHNNMPRNMALYQLNDGSLLIHSAIALSEPAMQELERLGVPRILVVPNKMHRLDAGVYKDRYPRLQVIAPKAAMKDAASKVHVDASCEEVLPAFDIICHEPAGVRPGELCYEVDAGDGKALIFTDLLFNMQHGQGLEGFLLKVVGSTGFFGITTVGKLLMLKNKKLCKVWLQEMSRRSDIKYISVAHGDPITRGAPDKLKTAAERL